MRPASFGLIAVLLGLNLCSAGYAGFQPLAKFGVVRETAPSRAGAREESIVGELCVFVLKGTA